MFNFPFYSYYPHTIYRRYIPENKHYMHESNSSNVQNQTHANDRRMPSPRVNTGHTTNNVNGNPTINNKLIRDNKKNFNERNKIKQDSDDTIFEIFGIKLHFDDILLICLIFFLYNEGVKDESLFITLILLLLS